MADHKGLFILLRLLLRQLLILNLLLLKDGFDRNVWIIGPLLVELYVNLAILRVTALCILWTQQDALTRGFGLVLLRIYSTQLDAQSAVKLKIGLTIRVLKILADSQTACKMNDLVN
jgi:hypothetical protein